MGAWCCCCCSGCKVGLRSWLTTSIFTLPRFPEALGTGHPVLLSISDAHSLVSSSGRADLFIDLYFSIALRYSPCTRLGTGTSRNLTSRVSLTPLLKIPKMFLQTRPVMSFWDCWAGASGVGADAASARDSIPCPTRGLSYSE